MHSQELNTGCLPDPRSVLKRLHHQTCLTPIPGLPGFKMFKTHHYFSSGDGGITSKRLSKWNRIFFFNTTILERVVPSHLGNQSQMSILCLGKIKAALILLIMSSPITSLILFSTIDNIIRGSCHLSSKKNDITVDSRQYPGGIVFHSDIDHKKILQALDRTKVIHDHRKLSEMNFYDRTDIYTFISRQVEGSFYGFQIRSFYPWEDDLISGIQKEWNFPYQPIYFPVWSFL